VVERLPSKHEALNSIQHQTLSQEAGSMFPKNPNKTIEFLALGTLSVIVAWAGGCCSVVEHIFYMHKALGHEHTQSS
jgi:hypothetical protein